MMQNPLIQRYLEQFAAGLGRLPEQERQEIRLEIESHIAEAISSGKSVADVLERLGPADRLARAYTVDVLLSDRSTGIARWLTVAGIMAVSGLPSLIIIPLLGSLGFAFSLGSLVAILAVTIDMLTPYGTGTLTTSVPGFVWPGGPAVLAVLVSAVLAGLGWGAISLLRSYIRFLTSTIRKALG